MTDLERKAVQRVFELLEIAQGDLRDATEILRQALAQPEQEPVAWRNTETGEFCTGGFLRKDLAKWMPLYTAPPSIEAAVLAEREACAKLCEEILEPWLLKEYIDKTVDAIRARGEK